MALTITPQISGQQADSTLSYCFINEPLKVHVTDSDSAVTQIFVDVTQINNFEATGLSSKVKYIVRDIVSLGGIAIDLMKVVKQLHDFDVYHFSDDSELANAGKDSVLSKYIYRFDFYTNISTTPTTILKLPILGGRTFQNFVPAVNYTTPIRELGAGDFDDAHLLNYTNPVFSLRQISSVTNSDYSLITQYDVAQGSESCEGRIVWKSKLGGWMYWGMNLKTSKINGSHSGNIDNGMFESTVFSGGGSAYIPVNYTSVKSSNSITLKCLSLTAEELIAVAEISGSPAVYYQSGPSEKLELMKLTSATAPIKTHINGGDFSVSLSGLFEYESRVK
tara:strand:+ start:169 stop:1173 length:1005 start_codon:yes stop_codon:yes gene_type:complete